MRNQMKLKKKILTGPVQGERACIKESEHTLLEILANRMWKFAKMGWLGWQEIARPVHFLFVRISNKILETFLFTLCVLQDWFFFCFIGFLIGPLWQLFCWQFLGIFRVIWSMLIFVPWIAWTVVHGNIFILSLKTSNHLFSISKDFFD